MALMDHITEEQREALWKWRWLGWKGSTPAFKLCIFLSAIAAGIIAFKAL